MQTTRSNHFVAAGLFMHKYGFLPQTYLILIISVLHSYGTKMFPQFE